MVICGNKKPELLAPAGSFDGMRAAVNAGADAVYMGGRRFGARAFADNPDEEGVIKAIEFCHARGRKLYLTVNTLIKDEELENGLYEYLLPYYEAGLDAVIVQDIGAMEFIGRFFPGLDIHISTQATITGSKGIEGLTGLLSNPGSVKRIVPARELSLEELKLMRKETGLELEVFVQGALCYCYSGQCLFSSFAGGRSGNRGRCAQPCRRLYEAIGGIESRKGYFLSTKDMCTLGILPELIDIGIDSFKIEGRMKSEEYAAGVVSVYREFIDRYLDGKMWNHKSKETETGNPKPLDAVKEKGVSLIRELYNRGGFNEGYLNCHNGRDMMSTKRPGHYGVYIGKVENADGRKAYIRVEEPVFKGDVLEIRGDVDEKAVYEFTLGESYEKGTVFSILTMRDRKAAKGFTVYRTKKDVLLTELHRNFIERDVKIGVTIYLEARIGEPLYMSMKLDSDKGGIDKNCIERDTLNKDCLDRIPINGDASKRSGLERYNLAGEYVGQTVQKAQTAASSKKEIIEQVSKLGNTVFYASETRIVADEGVFISVGELKKGRRECAEKLYGKLIDIWKRKTPDLGEALSFVKNIKDTAGELIRNEEIVTSVSGKDMETHSVSLDRAFIVSVRSIDQLRLVSDADVSHSITDIYMDISAFQNSGVEPLYILDMVENGRRSLTVKLPLILRSNDFARTKEFCEKIKDRVTFLVSNYESLELVKEIGGRYRTDHNIYCWNRFSKNILDSGYTLPEELNETELKEIAGNDGEMIVYGLLPVMVSAQCVYKTITGKCGKHEDISLKDEKGFIFRTHSECGYCYNCIYNSAVKSLFEKADSVLNLGCKRIRAEITFEDASEIRLVVKALESIRIKLEEAERSLAHNERKSGDGRGEAHCMNIFPAEIMGLKLTNGHLFRGVE